MRRAAKREQLIDAAAELFNRYGYQATGVDRIMEETGISKTTLYRHFASKDELVVAVLAKADEMAREDLRLYVERTSSDPRERVLATFGQLDIWLKDDQFRGCPFISAAAEYGDLSSPVLHQARLHKRLTLAYFEELTRAARLPDPKRFAVKLMMLHEGAIAFAQVLGPDGVAANAREAAERLMSPVA